MTILDVKNLNVRYGSVHAVHDLNLHIQTGELVCLIGANGAGKSSTLNAILGLVDSTGHIAYAQENMRMVATHARVKAGLSLVPEGRGVFTNMTVLENLQMGAYNHLLHRQDLESIFEKFPRLFERREQLAGTLSGGEQQMLAIGRALLSRPKLLLLDEPSMGLAPLLIKQIFATIASLKQEGLSILLVEQNAKAALALADRAYVLEQGKLTMTGTGAALLSDKRVQAAYLGVVDA